MRIAIITDAWYPQINGVVRTLSYLRESLLGIGHEVFVIGPDEGLSAPCPTYPDIRLALRPYRQVSRELQRLQPDAVHIATEGPLGWAGRFYCRRHGLRFTTSFHTKFAEYVYARARVPLRWTYGVLRHFHDAAECVMVNTPSMRRELEERGFDRLKTWSRGVDTQVFRPRSERIFKTDEPVLMYVGRVAVEKNIEDFLQLDVEGAKVVVGDGPQLSLLKLKYPKVHFLGAKFGEELAACYASADVFVFPSKTDTFGLVLLEALASGVPVAAFPVTGPVDVITDDRVGCLDWDLKKAVGGALKKSSRACREFALNFSWEKSTQQFLHNLIPV